MILFLADSQTSSWTTSPSLPVLPALMTVLIFLEQFRLISALGFYIYNEFSLKIFSLKYFFSLKFLPEYCFLKKLPDYPLIQLPSLAWSPHFYPIILFYFIHRTSISLKLSRLFVTVFFFLVERKLNVISVILLLHSSQNNDTLLMSWPEYGILQVFGLV